MAKVIHLKPRRKQCAAAFPAFPLVRKNDLQRTCFRVVTPIHFEIARRLGPNALRTVLYLKSLQGRPTTFACIAADLHMDAATSIATLAALERAGHIQCTRSDNRGPPRDFSF